MTAQQKVNLLGLSRPQMEEFFLTMGEKKFRAQQVLKWIHHHQADSFEQMTDVGKALRQKLSEVAEIRGPEVTHESISRDGTRKWVFEMDNGGAVETVFIPDGRRGTLCVSSQVGCAVDCSFCSTGKQGFQRDMTSAEIIGQVWQASRAFGPRRNLGQHPITNVVMMGMGEPLLNYDKVLTAMRIMKDDLGYGIGKKRITVSTSGVIPKMNQLSEDLDVSLAVSLHAPNDELRNELVPINKKYPIQELLDSVKRYVDSCGDKRVTTIEYILIDGINDELFHAEELAELLKQLPSKINLIPFNTFEGSDYLKPSGNRVKRFQKYLQDEGYVTTIRSTRGDDIMAACGQLVGQVNDKTRRKERAQKNQIKTKAI